MDTDCPICPPGACKAYPYIWAKMRTDRETWFGIHEELNGRAQISKPYPSLAAQAGNAAAAVGRTIAAAMTGQAITVDVAEQDRRLGICRACPEFDQADGRCRVCGCYANLKTRLATSHCPLIPPRW